MPALRMFLFTPESSSSFHSVMLSGIKKWAELTFGMLSDKFTGD